MPVINKPEELPEALYPYEFHKLSMTVKSGSKEVTADCPFCGRSQKLSINSTNGMWRCLVCNEGEEKGKSVKGGNSMSFLRTLFRLGMEAVETQSIEVQARYKELALERGFIQTSTLTKWQIAPSLLTGEWTIPSYNPEGKLCQFSRYARVKVGDGYKNRWLNTKGLAPQIFGMHLWNKTKPFVYVCEGPWDAMILYEMLTNVKRTENGLAPTGSIRSSLYNDANIIALPGCNQFNERWSSLFEGMHVILLFDNDHPKRHPRTGQLMPPAALLGAQRVTEILTAHHKPPESINYLRWGTEGFDPSLPSGTDLRDVFKSAGNLLGPRIKALDGILGKVTYVPDEWVKTAARASSNGSAKKAKSEEPECTSYRDLVMAWRKAMKWTDGLDHALACMLSTAISTMRVGDQLWMKIIGPASCLDGSTKIYDPIDGTNLTVKERTELGRKFSVYSRTQSGELVIAQALPPEEYPKTPMFELTMKSGTRLKVTAGHEIWNGTSYVSVQQVYGELQRRESYSYRLASISESDLLAHKLSGQHSKGITLDWTVDYSVDSYLYGELPPVDLMDDLFSSPLHICAPELGEYDCSHKVGSLRNHQLLNDDRFSSSRVDSRVLSSRYEDEVLPHSTLTNTEQLIHSSPSVDNTQLEKARWNKGQSNLRREKQAIDCGIEYDSRVKSLIREPEMPLTFSQSQVENDLQRRDEYNYQSSLGSSLSSLPYEESRYSTGDNDEELLIHNGTFRSIQRMNDQLDSKKPVPSVMTEANLLEQPRYVSINELVKLGELTLTDFDEVVNVRYIGDRPYYDFHVPLTNNYWAEGFFHHNCGKTTLGQALASNEEHVIVRDVIRGFTSGWRQEDGNTFDLASEVNGKTMLTLDGDTLIQSPGLTSILSEGRRLYDGSLTSHFKNGAGKDIADHRFTWLMYGTSSLRSIDSSELGERFLDCVVMEGIDDELEDEILMRVANRVVRNMSIDIHQIGSKQDEPDMMVAKAMTSGYLSYLKKNLTNLMSKVATPPETLFTLTRLGKFVAFMRARPSELQDETAEREFAARLVSQHIRLASCLAVVLNKDTIEGEPLKRTRRVALDTARGKTMEISRYLYNAGEEGIEPKTIALYTTQKESDVRKLLKFLRMIQVAEIHMKHSAKGLKPHPTWRLTKQLQRLWAQVHEL